jgi:hypothetical protein
MSKKITMLIEYAELDDTGRAVLAITCTENNICMKLGLLKLVEMSVQDDAQMIGAKITSSPSVQQTQN